MTLQTAFTIAVVLYTVTNLAAMGLELNLRESLKSLRSARQCKLPAATDTTLLASTGTLVKP